MMIVNVLRISKASVVLSVFQYLNYRTKFQMWGAEAQSVLFGSLNITGQSAVVIKLCEWKSKTSKE